MHGIYSGLVRRRAIVRAVTALLIAGVIAGQMGPVYSSPSGTGNYSAVARNRTQAGLPVTEIGGDPVDGSSATGLQIVLSEGTEVPQPVSPLAPAPAEPLGPAEIQPILDRMPPLTVAVTDTQEFRLPAETLPPPRAGTVLTETFPTTATVAPPEQVVAGPLEVLRYAPEGEIPLAPFLSVTFNQPMAPLATVEELAAADVPVRITPELSGAWRWVGTQTLTFEYDGGTNERFPMATVYTAEVPAGTQSATGGTLAEAVTWTFSTPAPQLTFTHPNYGPQPRDPILFAGFNQRIDPDAVLATISVTAGGQTYPLRLATDAEIEADADIARLSEQTGEGRWLAFRAEQPFPTDTTVAVNVGPNTPSAEGPLTSEAVQSFSFQTYAALRVTEHGCMYGRDCPPLTPFYIRFNNPLDPGAFSADQVTVEPAIPGLSVDLYGSSLQITGATQGRTTYTLTLSGAIRDIFGQTLGDDQTLIFETGPAQQALYGPNKALVTLDPSAEKPVFTVYTTNYERLRVRVYAVTPEDWPAYQEYLNNRWQEPAPTPPGQEVFTQIFQIEAKPDTLVETHIDLTPALETGGSNHLIVLVDQPRIPLLDSGYRQSVEAWVQVTQIGLDAFADYRDVLAWTTALQDGHPLAGVEVSLLGAPDAATTGSDGLAQLALPDQPSALLIARMGEDSAILPRNPYGYYYDGWQSYPVRDEARWYIFDDRQMYRPGEEVHVKGWIRRIGNAEGGDVGLLQGLKSVRYQVYDPQGNLLVDEMTDANDLGGFDFAFTIPEGSNLGYANIYLTAVGPGDVYGLETYHNFQIQEFRRPEFAVTARNEQEGPFFADGSALVAVEAAYFAGGPLPNAETTWNVTATPGSYTPPNWSDFTFGKWFPWWGYFEPLPEAEAFDYSGRTDPSGNHYLRMDFSATGEPQPYSVLAEAVVMDVNRQAWAATTNLLVHPADLYIGLRSARTFVEKGDPLEIDAIVVDLDGNAVADRPIEMRAARLEWKIVNGMWQEQEADAQTCSIASELRPVTCAFTTEVGGEYRITATVTDATGRANLSQFTRWVSGGQVPPARNVEREEVRLIPDKESYQPGETAEILVQAPFTPAEGLMTLNRSGIVSSMRFAMTEPTFTLRVPIEDEYIPNIYVNVDLVGAASRLDDQGEPRADLPPRPAYASGQLNLPVPPLSRQLAITAALPAAEFEPGAETTLAVKVVDATGAPVENAELAIVVVDEAILALTNYQLADPIETFYQARSGDMTAVYARDSIVLANAQALAEQMAGGRGGGPAAEPTATMMAMPAAPMAEAPAAEGAMAEESVVMADVAFAPAAAPEKEATAGASITIRTDFNPLATFAPAERTDATGQVEVPIKLPDNLTRYRIMVVGVADGRQFGSAESNLTARLPLMVRPSAPRFLNFGDRFALPVVVQNQTDTAMTVDVVVQAGNLDLPAGQGLRVEVPANDRREVRFPAATLTAGTARLQIAAVSGDYADAATVAMPVYTPATTEAFATYGVVDDTSGAVVQPVASPTNVFPQFGGLEIATSSTALQSLTDAVLYLTAYPFECSEQLASRVLGIASLRDVLTAFAAEGLPEPGELDRAVQRDIERLEQLQNGDGGWPVWYKGRESVPFYSIHVAHALQRARLKGYTVSDDTLALAMSHLRDIENYFPYWYGPQTRHALSSYALYVRDLMNDVDTPKARTLLNQYPLEEQSFEAIGWLWQVLSGDPGSVQEVEEIRRFVNNRAVETAGAANFITSYGDDAYLMLHSDRRTDAIVLDAMINDQPDSDLIPKVVAGLLAHRTQGSWRNTQENVFVPIALDRYFNTFESVTPDFVARMWLGDTYVAAHEFEGRTTDTRETTVPMTYLVDPALGGGATQDLIIGKEGEGRLYYRLGLRYAPDDLDLDPLDMGFTVQRIYEAVDDPADVRLDEDGTWRIRAGARVRVKLTMVANTRRYHVALTDPLPAGLESINPALAVSEQIPSDPADRQDGWWWFWSWYEHQNLRDQRAEAFTTLLWEGVYTYSYVARATTPGEFVVPPAKAEEMYSPEVFGRSGTDRVIVE